MKELKRTPFGEDIWFNNLWKDSGRDAAERLRILDKFNARFIQHGRFRIEGVKFEHEEDMIRFLLKYSFFTF